MLFCTASGPDAGEAKLAWNAVVSASGYYVDYGTAPDDLRFRHDAGSATSTTIDGLSDCQDWFFATRAYDGSGLPGQPSVVIQGWPRPIVSSPATARQGEFFTLDVGGTNFHSDAELSVDNPNVALASVTRVDCGRLQVAVSVGPAGPGARAAQIGTFGLRVANPSGMSSTDGDFVVTIDATRFDVDRSQFSTMDRLDGGDLSLLAFDWGGCDVQSPSGCNEADRARYNPDLDFDGDGWIDGEDLAYIAMDRWGRCWSPLALEWIDSPIVHPTAGLICPTVNL